MIVSAKIGNYSLKQGKWELFLNETNNIWTNKNAPKQIWTMPKNEKLNQKGDYLNKM